VRTLILTAILLITGTINALAAQVIVGNQTYDVPICGGFAQIPCGPKEYCEYPMGAVACGMGDQFGKCQPRPQICPQYIIEGGVCGCNGRDYGNGCFAEQAGTTVAHVGRCTN
jgi:hypothetical protein